MNNIINLLIDYGPVGIAIAAFCEPIFMPLPMELIFVPIALSNPSMAVYYSLILIAFSTLGSSAGYFIGRYLGRPLLKRLLSKNFEKLKELYNKNAFLTVLTSTFTPIPYEAYVLSAGTFQIGLIKFIAAASLSRMIRYLPQGIVIMLYGGALPGYLKNYIIILGIAVFFIAMLFKYLLPKLL